MHHANNSNRLIAETSPYLLQHAHNPVDWYPWGEEALAKARREDKPILLSIGYSACHWCHVMAHESFEDADTAALMNAQFVNIKVDREERPDLDKVYQAAHQLLAQRAGGWPLTMFLNPADQAPFFGGTYFPPEPRYGMLAFKDVLQRVAAYYHDHRGALDEHGAALGEALGSMEPGPADPATGLTAEPLATAREQLGRAFEPRFGGFGGAPKFPHPGNLERLLRHWAQSRTATSTDTEALEMLSFTLTRMALGGIYDQLGGGFCRYSVDERWMIPHFEKMLYDNAQLLPLYADMLAASGDAFFGRIATGIADWVMREMQSPEGGYYSTLDADSEGEEGKFYTWTREEMEASLSPAEFRLVAHRFGLDGQPNFEGKWNPHVYHPLAESATALALEPDAAAKLLESACDKLLRVRAQRPRPGRDEKVLTAWNGLMIKAMAVAARRLARADYQHSAERALDFIRDHLWIDGRLLAVYKDGRARLAAYLDDYVFLLDGTLELLQTRWRDGDIRFAVALADALLVHFEDRERGGFFFVAHDHERLLQRPKPYADDALPAGNGIAACALARLGHLLGEPRYLEASERTLKAAWTSLNQAPYAHTGLLTALEEYLAPPQTIILRGEPAALVPWHRRCARDYAPRRLVLAIPANVADLPGVLGERRAQNGPTAYLCSGTACRPPVHTLAELEDALGAS